jgi:3-dehydroquinate synthase
MTELRVNLKKTVDDSYDIVIGKGMLSGLPARLKRTVNSGLFAIITDSNVAGFYLEKLRSSFAVEGLKTLAYVFKAGEKSKSRKVKSEIEDFLLENNVGRNSCIVALGGGVTGDMAGFVAATYCRGIPFVQVPTTLLSQVDSSVGGKVAVDTPHAKNMIGAFYQPRLVMIDVETLETIPAGMRLNGIGEIIKHGIILDKDLFEFIENNAERIKNYDTAVLQDVVTRNCGIKRGVVESDEKETGLRKILNFGHTIGHAVEVLSRYRLSHDRCVMTGMYYESLCANAIGLLGDAELHRIAGLIKKFLPDPSVPKGIKPEDVVRKTYLDKKVKDGVVKYALPERIGKAGYDVVVDEQIIRQILSERI